MLKSINILIPGDLHPSKIGDYAADLRQQDEYRYHKDLSRAEEEKLLIQNIEELFGPLE